MKFPHRGKRVAALATVFATAAFMVQLAMPSALAVSAPDNVGSIFPAHDVAITTFANDYSGATGTDMAILSDKGDGVDSAAHLTAVSSPADTTVTTATLMNWYYCDSAALPGATGDLCTLIGTDTTATSAFETATYTGGTIDDAWSITWDILPALDNLTKRIVAEGCNGAPDSTHSNCTADSVPGVLLDDSSSGANPQTSSGEITSSANGSALSDSAALTLTASTSPELTAVAFGFDPAVGSGDDGDSPNGSNDVDTNGPYADTIPTTTATARTWSVTVTGAQSPNNDEQALTLFSTNNGGLGGGVVSAICTVCTAATGGMAFDRHYVVLEPGTPGTATNVFLRQTSDVTADPTCETGPTTIGAAAGSTVSLTGCLFDAFGTGVSGETVLWSLNTGGTAFFTTTPPTTTDANGQAVATVSAPTSAAGTNTTVTFCVDHNGNGVCDSTALTASFQITWSGPSGGGKGHARSVTLRLRDHLRARGKVRVSDGFSACASRVPVKVQRRVSGHWSTVKSVKTSSSGAYRTRLTDRPGRYRALAPKVTKAGEICRTAKSGTRTHRH